MSPPRIDSVPFEWQPDVWVLMAALAGGYVWALRRLGPRVAPTERVRHRQVVLFFAGLVALTISAVWPLDTIGDGYLFSLHMVQYLFMSLVAAPLLLAGVPAWLLRRLTAPIRPVLAGAAPRSSRCWPSTPSSSSATGRCSSTSTCASMSCTLPCTSRGSGPRWLFWFLVLNPLPEYPRTTEPLQMGYLFLSSVIPTVPASFLTWAENPLFDRYTQSPRLWGITAVQDVQTAGLVMKLGGGFLLWSVITVIFFCWAASQQEHRRGARRRSIAVNQSMTKTPG